MQSLSCLTINISRHLDRLFMVCHVVMQSVLSLTQALMQSLVQALMSCSESIPCLVIQNAEMCCLQAVLCCMVALAAIRHATESGSNTERPPISSASAPVTRWSSAKC